MTLRQCLLCCRFILACSLLAALSLAYVYPNERSYDRVQYDDDASVIVTFEHEEDGNVTILQFVDTLEMPQGKRFKVPRYFKTLDTERALDELKFWNEEGRWSERVVLEILYFALLYGKDHDPDFGRREEGAAKYGPLEIAKNWMDEDKDICEWEGITCGDVPRELPYKERRYEDHFLAATQRCSSIPEDVVTAIELKQLSLKGTLPTELADMLFLERLVLHGNFIKGTIPSVFGEIRGLNVLDLSDNEITGTMPDSMSKLSSSIEELWLEHNKLGGPIPTEFGKLTLLRYGDLGENQLTGSLPTELAQLTKMVALFLEENNLNGTLPSEYSKLPLLRIIDVEMNNLSGTIPSSYGLLPHLIEIFLQDNRFTGTLPKELLQLSILEYFFIDNNMLSGTLPKGDKHIYYRWSNLKRLREFTLRNNSFTGTFPVAMTTALTTLQILDMRENSFTGTLPTEIGLLKELRSFIVSENRFSGSIPKEIAKLKKIQLIGLQDNRFTGKIPRSLCELPWQMREFLSCDTFLCPPGTFSYDGSSGLNGGCRPCHISEKELEEDPELDKIIGQTKCSNETFIRGDIDADGALSEWEVLMRLYADTDGGRWGLQFADAWLDWNMDKCDLPGITCVSSSITKIDLSNAQLCSDGQGNEGPSRLCDGLPTELGLLSNLEVLNLPRRHFLRGTLPSEIGMLTNLAYLDVMGSQLHGSIPSELGLLTRLRTLKLENCNFKGTIPTELFRLRRLESLALSMNSLSGTIPSEIRQLVRAKDISISRCLLNGTIPSSIGMLSASLENIELYGNYLSGPLPSEMGRLTVLRRFDAFNNDLSGTLPEAWRQMKALQVLHLKRNDLTGTLPSFFGHLPLLSWLDLTSNMIHGTIPMSLSHTTTLKDLRLGGNRIYHPMPSQLCSSKHVNSGLPQKIGCDAILCSRGTYASSGFATDSEECKQCPKGQTTIYLGATSCQSVYTEDILAMVYDLLHGDEWPEKYRRGWKNDNLDYCQWGGIECVDGELLGLNLPVQASDPP